jgi:hypothetical protein
LSGLGRIRSGEESAQEIEGEDNLKEIGLKKFLALAAVQNTGGTVGAAKAD